LLTDEISRRNGKQELKKLEEMLKEKDRKGIKSEIELTTQAEQ